MLRLSLALVGALVLAGIVRARERPVPARGTVATEADARATCATCHVFPPPEILPRRAWRDALVRMASIRDDLPQRRTPRGAVAGPPLPPDLERVLAYYEAKAPVGLPSPPPWPPASSAGFSRHGLSPAERVTDPAVSHVQVVDVDGDGGLEVVAADMRYGMALAGDPHEAASLEVLARLSHPARLTAVDFDRDGVLDLIASDLGEFLPSDHQRGSVAWLRGTKSGRFETLALDGWPRVAATEPADLNGDGTVDLVVAAFGWRKAGSLTVLENHTSDYTRPSFIPRVVDPRPGVIRAVPADLNGDGRPDLIALFAQQFEAVVAFINNGTPQTSFTSRTLYTAPHPNWGSSALEVVDLDDDGDVDVLLTHGDTFDDDIIKPYHGILWLENLGANGFAEHRLADLPGASSARAGDLDGDGDLDVVAGAFIAGGADIDPGRLPSLVWLEQVTPRVFERRTLEVGSPRHATLDLADYDRDGDLDIVVGNFVIQSTAPAWVDVWQNLRLEPSSSR